MVAGILSSTGAMAASDAASPPASSSAVVGSGLGMSELLELRDPFRPKSFQGEAKVYRGALENFPSDAFKMVGVVTGPNRARAVLIDPEGHTHFVALNAKIGTRNGSIVAIQEDKVLVREKIADVFGNFEEVETLIPLQDAVRGSSGGAGTGRRASMVGSSGGGGRKGGGGGGGGRKGGGGGRGR